MLVVCLPYACRVPAVCLSRACRVLVGASRVCSLPSKPTNYPNLNLNQHQPVLTTPNMNNTPGLIKITTDGNITRITIKYPHNDTNRTKK